MAGGPGGEVVFYRSPDGMVRLVTTMADRRDLVYDEANL